MVGEELYGGGVGGEVWMFGRCFGRRSARRARIVLRVDGYASYRPRRVWIKGALSASIFEVDVGS